MSVANSVFEISNWPGDQVLWWGGASKIITYIQDNQTCAFHHHCLCVKIILPYGERSDGSIRIDSKHTWFYHTCYIHVLILTRTLLVRVRWLYVLLNSSFKVLFKTVILCVRLGQWISEQSRHRGTDGQCSKRFFVKTASLYLLVDITWKVL